MSMCEEFEDKIVELKKEAEDKGVEYADSLEYTIPKFSDEEGYCWSQVEQSYEKGALDFAEPREKRITDLEKKNTKLKERNAELAGQKASLERLLSEAKAIIRKYYNYNPSCDYSYKDIDKQAEQFLRYT